MSRTARRVGPVLALVALSLGGGDAGAAGGYARAERACGLDRAIDESSGVASASWADDVVWTHNDSGDDARFFAVSTTDCSTLATYTVRGAEARDWEDMTRAGTTLYFGDIGDNAERRPEVTVYEVAEPGPDAPAGAVRPAATRVLRYPDGSHNAESLLIDPTTDRIVIVTKTDAGLGTVYRAPESGQGTMERVADLDPGPAAVGLAGKAAILATGADAIPGRLIVRTYVGAFEWDVPEGTDLGGALAQAPARVPLALTVQGEAIAYTRDGTGLWTTSEGDSGPLHRLAAAPAPEEGATTTTTADEPGDDPGDAGGAGLWLLVIVVVALLIAVGIVWKNRTRPE
jgi:hypothetical protein